MATTLTAPSAERWDVITLTATTTGVAPTRIVLYRRTSPTGSWSEVTNAYTTAGVGIQTASNVPYPLTGGPVKWVVTVRQYQEWRALVYFSGGSEYSNTLIVKSNTPVLSSRVARTPIDCAAYLGKSVSNIPIIHFAQQGTALATLKSDTPLTSSYFHSNSPYVVCTAIHEFTTPDVSPTWARLFNIPSATARSFDNRALLFSFQDKETGDWVNLQPFLDYRYPTIEFLPVSGSSSVENKRTSRFWVPGITTAVQVTQNDIWATNVGRLWDKMRVYVLNINIQPNSINLIDMASVSNPSGVYIDDTAMYVNKLNMNAYYPLVSLSTEPLRTPNYVDDVIAIDGAYIVGTSAQEPKYNGASSKALQVLGSRSGTGWNIQPNKGLISKGGYPWWDAAFGRTRVSMNPLIDLKSFNTFQSKYAYPLVSGNGISSVYYYNDNTQAITTSITHVPGAIYGIVVKPIALLGVWTPVFSPSVIFMSLETGVKSYQPVSIPREQTISQTKYDPVTTQTFILWSVTASTTCYITRTGNNTIQINLDSVINAYRRNTAAECNYPTTFNPNPETSQISIFQIY